MKLAMRATGLGKKITLIATAFVLAVSTLTASVPFILSQNANAAPGVVYQGIPSVAAPAYASLGYAATSTNEFGDLIELGGSNRLLDDVTLNFTSWACETGAWNTNDCASNENATFSHPVTVNLYNVGTNGAVGSTIASKTQTITAKYRPSADNTNCIGANVGKWYNEANTTCYNGVAFNQTFDFSASNTVLPNQVIVGIEYNTANPGPAQSLNVSLPSAAPAIGTDVNSDVMYWDTSYAGNGSASGVNTFGPDTGWSPNRLAVNISADAVPTTSPCTTTSTVWSNNLTAWNATPGLDDTRASGHNELTGDGIRVYTDNNTSLAKATGYLAVNYPLSANGSQTISEALQWAQEYGAATPGLQLVIDFKNDGTARGILVGESIYGNNWWLTNGSSQTVRNNAPNVGGGNGSPYYGTLDQWLTKFPTAQVKYVGYSLGSGIYAGGVIKSMSFNCKTYKFDNAAPAMPVHQSPENNSVQSSNDFLFDWNDVAGATRYEIQNSTDATVNPVTGSFTNVMWTGDYQQVQPTESQARSVGANGRWYWQVRSIDAAGNASSWTTPWSITIDRVAPGAPTPVTQDWYIANGATKTLQWNAPADTDIAYYQYAEYNNVAPTSATTTPSWTKNINAPTTQTTDTAWGSDVKIFWRVRAVDAVGNVGPWSETRTIITDRTKPVATINNATVDASKKLNVTVTGTDNLSGVNRIEFNLYDATNTTKVANLKGMNYSAHNLSETSVLNGFDTASLADGTYVVRAAVLDDAGNLSGYATQSITIDNSGPTNPGTPIPLTPATSLTTDWTWVASTDNSGIKGYEYAFVNANDTPTTWTFITTNSVTTTAPADGTYRLFVRALDNVNNPSNEVSGTTVIATTPVVPGNGDNTGDTGSSGGATTTNGGTTTSQTQGGSQIFNGSENDAANQGVLGVSDTNADVAFETDANTDGEVKGESTQNNVAAIADGNDTNNNGGLAWYWWLLIVAAIGAALWWIIAAIRRRGEQA